MDPQLKQKWVKALRSGEYKKARRQLCRRTTNSARHCCLGVLRDLVGGDEPDDAGTLTSPTLRKAGLGGQQQADLAVMNDKVGGWDKVIAYIEENL